MDDDTPAELEEMIKQLEAPSCDHVGPYEKSGDNEEKIKGLFANYGYRIDDEGYAVPDEDEDDEEEPTAEPQGVLRVVAVDSAHSSDPDAFEYPDARRRHADEPIWGVWEHNPDEDAWDEVESGLTLAEAEDAS
jgi:hypothetical protein